MGRRLAVTSGPLSACAVWLLLSGAPIPAEAARLAGVLACVFAWWMSEAMPLAVAALLASAFCVVLRIAPARQVFAPYADPVIFLFLGSFWIARAMSVHGLDRRFALRLLSVPALRRSPARLVTGFGLCAAAISLWVSNTATVAMLLPVALGLAGALPEEARSRTFECRLLLMLSFAASVGGLGTPIGTPPNLIGIGMIERFLGQRVDFARWMAMAIPLVCAALAFTAALLTAGLTKPPGWGGIEVFLEREAGRLGGWSTGEKSALCALGVAVAMWLFAGHRVPEGVAAILAAGLLFVLPGGAGRRALTWEEACSIDWSVLLLFGGGMSLGQLLFDTRLAEIAGTGLRDIIGVGSAFGVCGLASGFALAASELASNTASANIAVPSAIALARSAGVDPLLPALSATVASSFGFLLPVSTPPNALVYGTGRVPLREMIRFGLALDLAGFLLAWWGLRAVLAF